MKIKLILLFTIFGYFVSEAQHVYEKIYSPNTVDFSGVVMTNDSGYILSGEGDIPGSMIGAIYLKRINEFGDAIWTKGYDGPASEGILDIKLFDSTLIVYGQTASFNTCDYSDFYLMKVKLNGDTIWTKHYGTCETDKPQEVIKAPNNGYYYYGTLEHILNLGTTLLRLNSSGDTVWTRFINMAGPSALPLYIQKQENFACTATPDGGILTTGMVFDSSFYPRSSFIMKIDSNGTIQWKKFFDTPQFNNITQVFTTPTGYLLQGYCSLNCPAVHNAIYTSEFGTMLLKIDFNGNVQWGKMYKSIVNGGYPFSALFKTSTMMSDGSVFVANVRQIPPIDLATSNQHHSLVGYKTDSTGNLLWYKKYNLNAIDLWPTNVSQTRDKGFLITLETNTPSLVYTGIMLKTDSLGNSCNDSTLTMSVVDFTNQIITSDTIVPVVAYYPVTLGHCPFTYIIAMNYAEVCNGNVEVEKIEKEKENEVSIFPNPNNGTFSIKSMNVKIESIKVLNLLGETIYQTTEDNLQATINLSSQPNGIYFVQVKTEKGILNRKIVIQ